MRRNRTASNHLHLAYLFKRRTEVILRSLNGECMAGIPDEQYVVDAEGKKKGVLLSIERYEQMTEDLHDLAIVAERREEECVSLDEMKRRLSQNGEL